MITIITFNPSIDRLYKIDKFEVGSVQRANFVNPTAGGKGLNVAKVLNKLGADINCIGFLGGFNGDYIRSQLEKASITNNFTQVKEETRICLNIIDSNGISTEVLENGPVIDKEEILNFEKVLSECLENTKVLVASGSLAKGLSKDYYFKIGQLCREKNIKYILDASGESLKLGLKSKPYLIKPNIEELKAISGKELSSLDEIVNISKEILLKDVKNVCVSLGKDGMIFINENNIYNIEIPKIKALNTVGSGDSSIAGFALGISKGYKIKDTLKLANACGISNAMHLSTGDINLDDVNELIDKIKVYDYI